MRTSLLLAFLLLGCDGLRGPVGPQGPKGDTGARGPAGADGLQGGVGPQGPAGGGVYTSREHVYDRTEQLTDGGSSLFAECLPGDLLLTGGCSLMGYPPLGEPVPTLIGSVPNTLLGSWSCAWWGATPEQYAKPGLLARASCLSIDGGYGP